MAIPEQLSAELEALLLRELRALWAWENDARFGRRLTPPVIALADVATRLGCWHRASRRLELSRTLVVERPWPEVQAVLLHEMAHQYVDEALGVRDETAHGESFRKLCSERGIDARSSGAPIAASTGELKILDRIRKLLALAGSANQHEAEMAMRKAHELMLRHNIEHAGQSGFEVRHLGDPERRGNRVESAVAGLLSEFFFIKVIRLPVYLVTLGRRGQVYEIAGTRANVELASHVYGFLVATAARLWQANRGDARVRSGRDRQSYQVGVINGFREKLLLERSELKGTGLVWVGDRGLDAFYRARNPRVVTRSSRIRLDGAHAAGREAGRTIVLHKPIEDTGSRSGAPRLLR